MLDVNVVLDAILERAPGADAAARLWSAIERGRGTAMIPAHGLTTIHYLLARARGGAYARAAVEKLMRVFAVAAVDGEVIRRALLLPAPDFEDAVCAAAAERSGCWAIVTRDPRGFTGITLPVIDPAAAVAHLAPG